MSRATTNQRIFISRASTEFDNLCAELVDYLRSDFPVIDQKALVQRPECDTIEKLDYKI